MHLIWASLSFVCAVFITCDARTVSTQSQPIARSLNLFDSPRSDQILPVAADSVPSAPDAFLEAAVGALAAQSQTQSHVIGKNNEHALPVANSAAAAPISPVATDDQLDVILKVLGNNKRNTNSNHVVLNPL
jgi:hypothetical protein